MPLIIYMSFQLGHASWDDTLRFLIAVSPRLLSAGRGRRYWCWHRGYVPHLCRRIPRQAFPQPSVKAGEPMIGVMLIAVANAKPECRLL